MTDEERDRLAKLERLYDAVARGIGGTPDHPWIPGGRCQPVLEAMRDLGYDADKRRGN